MQTWTIWLATLGMVLELGGIGITVREIRERSRNLSRVRRVPAHKISERQVCRTIRNGNNPE